MENEDGDLSFLSMLDREVHPTLESRVVKNGEYVNLYNSSYNPERKITTDEIRRIIEILKTKPYFIIYPVRVEYLSKIGFEIIHNVHSDGVEIKIPILRFLEEQLPGEYNFDVLLEKFGEENKRRIRDSGLTEIKGREHYLPKEYEMGEI